MKREWRKIYDQAKQWKLKLSVHGRYAGEVSVPAFQVLWKTWEMELWVSSTDAGTKRAILLYFCRRRLKDHVGMWGRETEGENKRNGRFGQGNSTLQPGLCSYLPRRPGGRHRTHPCPAALHAPSQEKQKDARKTPFRGGHFGSCQEKASFPPDHRSEAHQPQLRHHLWKASFFSMNEQKDQRIPEATLHETQKSRRWDTFFKKGKTMVNSFKDVRVNIAAYQKKKKKNALKRGQSDREEH